MLFLAFFFELHFPPEHIFVLEAFLLLVLLQPPPTTLAGTSFVTVHLPPPEEHFFTSFAVSFFSGKEFLVI